MILCALPVITLIVVIVQLVRLALSDCDLSLQWAEKFGKSVGKIRKN
jgi:hypothetical protein